MSDDPHNVTIVINYFARLNYPNEPIREDAREYLNRFFGEDGFIRLCDRMFGKYFWNTESERKGCWMDTANRNPTGPVAAEFFKLIAPGTHFFNALEAFSAPDFSFSSQLKFKWNADQNEEEAETSKYAIDFPLGALYQHYMRFLSESGSDIYDLSRSSCPAFLFIPFWIPPLVTRKEKSQCRILTSLRCSPLAYFFIRLIWYLFSRTDSLGQNLVTNPAPSGSAFVVFLKQLIQYNVKFTNFSFYYNITTVYLQHYITPSFLKNISQRRNIEDVTWSVKDVSAGMLLCFSYFLSARCFPEIDFEYQRGRRNELSSTANLFGVLPILIELYSTLFREYTPATPIILDFSVDSVSRSYYDLVFVKKSTFRNCLIAIREALFSLDSVSSCKPVCLLHLLKLWKVLLNPLRPEYKEYLSDYAADHLEAYIFLFYDILERLLKNSFFHSINIEAASVLRVILEYYNMDVVTALLQDFVKKSSDCGLDRFNFVLNWQGEDSTSFLRSLFDKESLFLATCSCQAIREKISSKKCSSLIRTELEKCIFLLGKIFPGCESSFDDLTSEKSFREFTEKSTTISSPIEISTVADASTSTVFCRKICVPAYRRSDVCRNELPFIANISKYIDCILVFLQEFFYRNSIPRCEHGHKLLLLEKKSIKCVSHSKVDAIWTCAICENNYCPACKGFPISPKGQGALEKNFIPSDCFMCNRFLGHDSLSYKNLTTSEVFCPICASRPFLPWTVRWIASYTTIALTIFFSLLGLFFCCIVIGLN